MASPLPDPTAPDVTGSQRQAHESSGPTQAEGHDIRHGSPALSVAPQAPPEAPPGSLLAELLRSPMPQASAPTIEHASATQTERQPLAPMSFHLQVGDERYEVIARVSPAVTNDLTDLQNNRLAALLSVGQDDWHDQTPTTVSAQHVRVSYEIDDPQATPRAQPSRIRIQLEIALRVENGLDRIDAVRLGSGEDALLLPVRERRPFEGRNQTMHALVPHRLYTDVQQQALQEQVRVREFSHIERSSNVLARYRFREPGSDGAPDRYFDASVELRRNSTLGAWVVVGVTAELLARPPLQVQQGCIDWLAQGLESPTLPGHVVAAIQGYIETHNAGGALPAGVVLRPTGLGHRLDMNVHLAGAGQGLEHWSLRINLVRHGEHDMVATVDLYASATRPHNATATNYSRPDQPGWTNLLRPRGVRGTSTFSSITASTDSRGSAAVSSTSAPPPLRDEVGETSALTTSEIRGQQAALESLILTEGVLRAGSPDPIGTSATAAATAATTTHAAGDVFMTEAAYRQRHGLPATTPACPPIAAGVALNRLVPFSAVRQYNANADREGSSGDEMQRLLVGEGGVAVLRKVYQQLLDEDPGSATDGLRQHLERHGHDAAVLLYRLNSQPGDPVTLQRGHHVAIFRDAQGQWHLHDGRENNGQPFPVTLDEAVRRTFGQNTQGNGELEVLSLVRPAPASAAAVTGSGAAAVIVVSSDEEDATSPEDASVESGIGNLSLSPNLGTTAFDQVKGIVRAAGFRKAQLAMPGSSIDWGLIARELVDQCNHTLRLCTPGEVFCEGVPLPARWSANAETLAGRVCNITLSVTGNVVTGIRIDLVRLGPVQVTPPSSLSFAPGSYDVVRKYLQGSLVHHPALREALPKSRGVVDLDAAVVDVLAACGSATAAWRVDPDKQGLEVLRYDRVPIHGVETDLWLRFNDVAAGIVRDLRIHASDNLEPPYILWK